MGIVKQTHLYELLIRFAPDGTVAGAHVKDLEQVIDEDELDENEQPKIIAATESTARPIKVQEMGALIGKKNAQMLEQIGALEIRKRDYDQALVRADEAENKVRALEGRLAITEAQRDRLELKIQAALAGFEVEPPPSDEPAPDA